MKNGKTIDLSNKNITENMRQEYSGNADIVNIEIDMRFIYEQLPIDMQKDSIIWFFTEKQTEIHKRVKWIKARLDSIDIKKNGKIEFVVYSKTFGYLKGDTIANIASELVHTVNNDTLRYEVYKSGNIHINKIYF